MEVCGSHREKQRCFAPSGLEIREEQHPAAGCGVRGQSEEVELLGGWEMAVRRLGEGGGGAVLVVRCRMR